MAAASPDAFHKITSGSNGVYCQAGTPANQPSALQCPSDGFLGFDASNYDTNTGYNLVTGLGSVDANNLATNWSGSPGTSDYSISANPASVTVLAGQSGTSTITVSATNGFSGTVNLSCSVSSSTAKMGCSLSPSSVSLSSTSTSATATLTVTTTSSSARIGTAASQSHDRSNWLQGSLGLLAWVGLFGFPRRARYRRSGLSLLLLSILASGVSCGGGGGSSGTPQGSYTTTVTGTSGSQTHTATVSVSVQ
jgi:hypothetical protein